MPVSRSRPDGSPTPARGAALEAAAHRCAASFSNEVMGNEARGVTRNGTAVLADAHPGGLFADDPGADDRVVAVEIWERVVLLVDARLIRVRAGCFQRGVSPTLDADVRAFAGA